MTTQTHKTTMQQQITGFATKKVKKSKRIFDKDGRKARRVGSRDENFGNKDTEMNDNQQVDGWDHNDDDLNESNMDEDADDEPNDVEVMKVNPPTPRKKEDDISNAPENTKATDYDGDEDDKIISDEESTDDEEVDRRYRLMMEEKRAEKEAQRMQMANDKSNSNNSSSNSSHSSDNSNNNNSRSTNSTASSSNDSEDGNNKGDDEHNSKENDKDSRAAETKSSENQPGTDSTMTKEDKTKKEEGNVKGNTEDKQKDQGKKDKTNATTQSKGQEKKNGNEDKETKDRQQEKKKETEEKASNAGKEKNQEKKTNVTNQKEKEGNDRNEGKNSQGKSTSKTTTTEKGIDNGKKKGKTTEHTQESNLSTNAKKRSTSPLIFKRVDNKSRNRRQCKKTKGKTSEGSSTPEAGNKSRYTHVFVSRVTFKLTVPAAQDMQISTMNVIRAMMKEIKKADKSFQFYPWTEENSHMKRLRKPEELTTMTEMKPYSSRLFTYKNNDSMALYPLFQIGHDITLEDIRKDIREWAATNECNIFWNMLQCESSTEIGYFCYSPRSAEPGALADEISDMIGIQVGLRWKVISTGKRGKIPDNKKVFALVVEVDKREKYSAQQALIKFFGRKIKETHEYPNGIRMRFVKNKSDALNTVEAAKLDRLRERQKVFLKSIQTCETEDIVQLDYSPTDGEPTLRQMIMNIKSNKYTATPLFHSVDLDWRGEGHIFTYSPKVGDEAECMVRTLLPYLSHKYPLYDVEAYFTDDAIARCSSLEVDNKTGMVIQAYDDDFNDEEEDLIIGFDLTIDINKEKATLQRPDKDKQAPMPEDDDSVSTLGERRTTVTKSSHSSGTTSSFTPNPPPRVHRRNQDGDSDDISIISGTSTVTMQTISMLDSKIENQTKAINKRLDLMFSKLFGDETNTTSASAAQADTPDTDHGTSTAGAGNETSSGKVSQK